MEKHIAVNKQTKNSITLTTLASPHVNCKDPDSARMK